MRFLHDGIPQRWPTFSELRATFHFKNHGGLLRIKTKRKEIV